MRVLIRISDVRLAGDALSKGRANGGTGRLIEGVKRGVRGLQGFVRRCCFVGAVASVLPACSYFDETLQVSPFLREQITGDTWNACLAREYQTQARFQVRSGRQWQAAITLATKGRRALLAESVDPEPAAPALSQQAAPALSQQRVQMLNALSNRTRNPCDCAKVQGRYDGWIIALNQDPGLDQSPFPGPFADAVASCTKPR